MNDQTKPVPTQTSAPEEVALESAGKREEVAHRSLGQRRVNFIWELTQAIIALAVTLSTLYVSARLALADNTQVAAFLLLSNAFFLVIGFYFGRTNHARTGGVGGDNVSADR